MYKMVIKRSFQSLSGFEFIFDHSLTLMFSSNPRSSLFLSSSSERRASMLDSIHSGHGVVPSLIPTSQQVASITIEGRIMSWI